ncbi:MAG: CFI-box-CTERM domain-containing protein [Oligoflexus sp.]
MMLRMIHAALIFATLLVSQLALSLTITNPTARIPRGGGDQVELRFQMLSITLSDLQAVDSNAGFSTTAVQNLIIAQLDVCVNPRSDICRGTGNLKARYAAQQELDRTPETDFEEDHIVLFPEGAIDMVEDPQSPLEERYNADVYLLVERTSGSQASEFSEDTVIYISYPSAPQDLPAEVQISSVVSTQPQGLAIQPSNQSLTVSWNEMGEVEYADGSTRSINGMRAYLVETEAGRNTYVFPNAMIGYEDDPADENTRYPCTLEIQSFAADDGTPGTCTFTCDNDAAAYLDAEAIRTTSGINTTIGEANGADATSYQFSNLSDTSKQYAAFIQPLPQGLRSSSNTACVMGSSILTFSYAQITGGDEPSLTDPRCFIATAAYGSSLHQHLDELRWFRDRILLALPFGENLVAFYYTVSPPLAQWIEERPYAAAATRIVLAGPVYLIQGLRQAGGMGLILFAAFFVTGMWYFYRRRAVA